MSGRELADGRWLSLEPQIFTWKLGISQSVEIGFYDDAY